MQIKNVSIVFFETLRNINYLLQITEIMYIMSQEIKNMLLSIL